MHKSNHAREGERCHLAGLEKKSAFFRLLGSDSTCNIQWDMESCTEGVRNTLRKNLTDVDEAEEGHRAGKPQPPPPCLETFTDSLQLVLGVGETHNLSPPHDGVLHIRRVPAPWNLCGEQKRMEGSGHMGQVVHVAPLLSGGAWCSPNLITVFSIVLYHGHSYYRIFHYPVCN